MGKTSVFALFVAAISFTAGFLPTAGAAQNLMLEYRCDLGGAPARMVMQVQYVNSSGLSIRQGAVPSISGVFPTGVLVYTSGEMRSAVAGYSFVGENQFADFTTLGTNERFRVQWVLDPANNGLWMVINPFAGAGAQRHFCALVRAQ
jgi:hypothetical protein